MDLVSVSIFNFIVYFTHFKVKIWGTFDFINLLNMFWISFVFVFVFFFIIYLFIFVFVFVFFFLLCFFVFVFFFFFFLTTWHFLDFISKDLIFTFYHALLA